MNSYISIVPSTLEIVDRFKGTEIDVQSRSSELEHIIVPDNINSDYVILNRNKDTNEIEISVDENQPQIIDMTWFDFRNHRNFLLKECDWIVSISDSPLSIEKIEEWKIYRQALRDLPANTTDPNKPEWPTPPE